MGIKKWNYSVPQRGGTGETYGISAYLLYACVSTCVEEAAASRPLQQSDLSLYLCTKKARKREFFKQMQQAVPWEKLVELSTPYTPEGRKGLDCP